MIDITKYMTKEELKEQLLMLSQVDIKNVNYQEFMQMFLKWEKPMNKQNTWWDLEDESLKIIRKRYKELVNYYE